VRVTHGCSFETPGGVWRKEYLEADLTEFPEAANLSEDTQVAYVSGRLEQKVLLLRWMFGNLNNEHYNERWAAIEAMCESWLHPKPATVDATAQPT
jgi:hypothetical protein